MRSGEGKDSVGGRVSVRGRVGEASGKGIMVRVRDRTRGRDKVMDRIRDEIRGRNRNQG